MKLIPLLREIVAFKLPFIIRISIANEIGDIFVCVILCIRIIPAKQAHYVHNFLYYNDEYEILQTGPFVLCDIYLLGNDNITYCLLCSMWLQFGTFWPDSHHLFAFVT